MTCLEPSYTETWLATNSAADVDTRCAEIVARLLDRRRMMNSIDARSSRESDEHGVQYSNSKAYGMLP